MFHHCDKRSHTNLGRKLKIGAFRQTPISTNYTACSVNNSDKTHMTDPTKSFFHIGITPDQTMYTQNFTMVYHGLRLLSGLLPQTMVKYCVYHGLAGGYSYSNMTSVYIL